MMPIKELFTLAEEKYPASCTYAFAYPFLTLSVISPDFKGLDEEECEHLFAKKIDVPIEQLRSTSNRGFIRLALRATQNPTDLQQSGANWVELIRQKSTSQNARESEEAPKYLHFYGFKGGQARSTSLCAIATSLAKDGWRVLAIDLDAEAPSLDLILGASTNEPARTVLGLRADEAVQPVSLGRTPRGGEVSVLPFRPRSTVFDLDAAALAFELQVYAPSIDDIISKIRLLKSNYDIILLDHRTGLGPIAPSVVKQLQGPVVVCARLDRQSEYAISAISALWATSVGSPGILLSLSPPETSPDQYRRSSLAEASTLLQALANASATGEDAEPREWSEFNDHWIVWPFDRAVANSGYSFNGISDGITLSVNEMRRLLNLSHSKERQQRQSGAKDEGDLIVTQALRQLRSPGSPTVLVVGRKGTGKTRLVRQLAEEELGEALLVPSDFPEELGGIKAGDLDLRDLAQKTRGREEDFWYSIICAAIESKKTTDSGLVSRMREVAEGGNIIQRLRTATKEAKRKRTFLVDALESTFNHEQTFPFVQALFRVLESLDASHDVSQKVQLKLFVRRDLLERGIQNREQFEDGRRLNLSWDVQTILNFVLTRMAAIPWYGKVDPSLVKDIQSRSDELREGQVATEECEELLLRIFPKSIQYKNIKTTTFFRTYFSDEGREPSFYPRVYLIFLEQIAQQPAKKALRMGRLDGKVIVKAHDEASAGFLQEVSQELMHAVPNPNPIVNTVLNGLIGKTTPFDPDALAKTIAGGARSTKPGDVRGVFDVMKQLGVFEDHPKRLNTWRAGRLFKTGLKMRFGTGS